MSGGAVTVPRRTPSVSEIQAALQAARDGRFASSEPVGDSQPPTPTPVTVPRAPVSASGTEAGATVTLISVHGGAGARTLAAVLPGTRYAGRDWPTQSPGLVVLVCRSNHRGYTAAQEFARAHRDNAELHARLTLVGVVVIADCPGRTPAPLRRLERLVSGALPILGRVPWMPEWRLGPPNRAAPAPEWLATLSAALAAGQ